MFKLCQNRCQKQKPCPSCMIKPTRKERICKLLIIPCDKRRVEGEDRAFLVLPKAISTANLPEFQSAYFIFVFSKEHS